MSMARIAVFTRATYTYFSRARTLAASLKRFHPDWDMVLLIPDDPPPGVKVDWRDEKFDQVITLADLKIPKVKSWLFRHNVVELCTAVKGFALKKLLAQGYDAVFYLDPDIAVFSPLTDLVEMLSSRHSVLLTPHQLEPETTGQGVVDNEWASLKYGVYNLGFAGVANDASGKRFASWWAERCAEYCRDDVPNGLFTDQRWCDLVPALFDRVGVVRDPGYNVASWNISKRAVRFQVDGSLTVNGSLLKFFHFTKVDHVGETMLRRYAGRHLDVIELMYWYRKQLKAHDLAGVPPRYWIYGMYEDGTPIDPKARRAYASLPDARTLYPDPFKVGPRSFRASLSAEGPGPR
jgi:hypothetical protein